jgi:hypothetical protein
MWSHLLRRQGALLGAGLLAAGLVGAAASSAQAATQAALTNSPRAATTRSARLAVVVSITTFGQRERLAMTGVSSPSAADLHLSVAAARFELRRIGQSLYVHYPSGATSPLPKGKTWAVVSLAAFDRQLGLVLPGLFLGAGRPLSATSVLNQLAQVSFKPPVAVGTARIHGLATTAYELEIDPAKAERGFLGPANGMLMPLLGGAFPRQVDVTVWEDHAGRLVQLHSALALHAGLAGTSLLLHVGVLAQTFGFGTPVRVSRPPAARTSAISASALASGLFALVGLGGQG